MRAALAVLVLAAVALAQTTPAAAPPEKKKTAGEEFKNIKVLKDVPADEWFRTMSFIAGSLGVGCGHCHVNPFAKDEKPAKERAREMMRMVQQINAQHFADQQNRVTCMTCHNGSTKPARTPTVAQAGWLKDLAAATAPRSEAPATPPDAAQIIADYRQTIGGRNLARVQSRYYKGTATGYNGAEAPRPFEQEIWIVGDRVRVDITSKQGTQTNIFDGRQGWLITPKETRAMNADEIAALRNRVVQALRVDYLPEYTQAVNRGAEEIRGHKTWAVDLTLADNTTQTFFFDQESDLLVARRVSDTSFFGKVPDELWLEDYRDFSGLKLPMTVITAGVSNGTVRMYDEIQVNLPVDMKKFAPPAAATGTGD